MKKVSQTDMKLTRQMGALSGKVTTAFKILTGQMSEMNAHIKEQNGRIGKLETINEYKKGEQKGSAGTWKTITILVSIALAILVFLYGNNILK